MKVSQGCCGAAVSKEATAGSCSVSIAGCYLQSTLTLKVSLRQCVCISAFSTNFCPNCVAVMLPLSTLPPTRNFRCFSLFHAEAAFFHSCCLYFSCAPLLDQSPPLILLYVCLFIFCCPGSSIPDLGQSVGD